MATATTERRAKPRNAVDRIAFIQMADGNSGTILDVSETGLRFRTVTAVKANGPVDFWYSMNLSDRVEAYGEVVWRNDLRKEGGIAFKKKPAESVKPGDAARAAELRTAVPKNSGGIPVLAAIPEMQEAEQELAAEEIEIHEEEILGMMEEEVPAEVVETPAVVAATPAVAIPAVKNLEAKNSEEVTPPVPAPVQKEQPVRGKEKPQWKIELEAALAARAAGRMKAAPGSVERAAEEREEESWTPTAKPTSAETAAGANVDAGDVAARFARREAATPAVPKDFFAEIAARENERFYMPPAEPELRSKWQFVKGAVAGMVVTAVLVVGVFYYLGLSPLQKNAELEGLGKELAPASKTAEAAPGNLPKTNEGAGTPNAAAATDSHVPNVNAANGVAAQSGVPQNVVPPTTVLPKTSVETGTASSVVGKSAKVPATIPAPNINGPVNSGAGIAQTNPAGAATPGNTQVRTVAPAADKTKYAGKVARTPADLWEQIAGGDTAAEITLAQMYATGDGIEKNCEQARVLLKAASAKGNVQALRTLDQVNATSCQ